MTDPYHAPAADFAPSINNGGTYEPAFAALSGRIGRARYLVYTMLPSFAMIFGSGLLASVAMHRFPVLLLLPVLANIPVIGLLLVMGARRLNDMNLSGWLSLLGLIPGVNLLLWLGLLAAPGTAGPNRHGPAPGKNTTGVLIAAWAGPVAIALVIGYTVAVLTPVFQNASRTARVDRMVMPAPFVMPAP